MALRIKRTPPEEMIRRWDEWRAKQRRKAAKSARERPRAINTETARGLVDTRERVFRGRRYRVPPLAFTDAAAVLQLMQDLERIQAADEQDWAAMTEWFVRAAVLAKRCCRPASPLGRLLWPLTPNPFRMGTLREVADLLGFTSAWVMIDLAPSEAKNGVRPGTSLPTSRAS